MAASAEKTERINSRRLWLFRIIAITVVPLLLFISLELVLRIAGYGYPSAAVIRCKVNGKDAYCDNVRFGWRFFPPNISRDFDPFVLPADKPPDTYRIFVLGSSAAQGVPAMAFSFGRILRVMLEQAWPGVNFEVVTVATAAINSHVVLEIAKSCARCEPDLFVLYLGNNEVVGPYGAGTVFAPLSSNLAFIRMGIVFKATRVGQLLTNLSQSIAAAGKTPAIWGGMGMFLGEQVRADDRRLETVYRHFRKNLEDISRTACKNRSAAIFCTVGSNLKDSPPFASLHRLDLTGAEKQKWDQLYQQGITYQTEGNYDEALKLYLAAGAIDDCYADLQFRLGRCYWAMAEYDKAEDCYIKARHLDTLRFRPDTQINEIIRNVAGGRTAEGIYLTDSAGVFEEHSPHNVPGEELFYEHVHLNFTGNYILAETVFQQIEKILPERIRLQRADKPLSTEADCARELAYTDWDRYKIAKDVLDDFIKKPPFTNQLYHKEKLLRAEQNLKDLEIFLTPEALEKSAAQYQAAIEKKPSDWWLHWRYAELLWEYLKDDRAAVEQYRQVLKFLPHYSGAYDRLGLLFGRNWDFDSAISYNLKAIQLKPTHSEAHFNLAFVYQLQGRIAKAIEYYSMALRLKPNFTAASENLGALLYQQGRIDKAEQAYRSGLIFAPAAANLHSNLAVILTRKGRITEAIEEYKAALQPNPGSSDSQSALEKKHIVSAYQDLGVLLYQQGRVDEALQTYRTGLLIAPEAQVLHHNLAVILNDLGRKDQALEELQAAVRIDPNYVKARKLLEAILNERN